MGRNLIYIWSALDVLYLGIGIGCIVFSAFIRMSNPAPGHLTKTTLRTLVISNMDLNAALILGIMTLISWAIGLYGTMTGMVKGKRQTAGLVAFNGSLVVIGM